MVKTERTTIVVMVVLKSQIFVDANACANSHIYFLPKIIIESHTHFTISIIWPASYLWRCIVLLFKIVICT